METAPTAAAARARRIRRETLLGVLLAVCLLLTAGVWRAARNADRRVADARFERMSEMTRRLALGEVGLVDGALRSARGLILGSQTVEPHEWRRFVASLRERGGLPGVRELAFVAPEAGARGTESIRAVLREADDTAFPETLDPSFRAATRVARESGEPVLTSAANDDAETLHLLLPVSRPAAAGSEPAFAGWVCAWLSPEGLFAGVLGADRDHLRLRVVAAMPGAAGPPVYDSAATPDRDPRFAASFPVAIGDRTWTATVSSRSAFEESVAGSHLAIAAVGVALGVGLWAGLRTVLIARDRALRLAEERTFEMRETEGRYREVFLGNAQPQLLVAPDDGLILDANPAARDFYGYERDGLPGRRVSDLCTEDDHGCERLLREAASLESAREFRARHRLASGLARDVELTACEIRVSGRAVIHVAIRDVTGRDERDRIERITARVFETANEAILITDRYNRIQMANPAFTRISGYDAAEVRGRDLAFLEAGLNPEGVLAGIRRALLRDGTWQGELHCRRKDGEVHPGRISISAIAEPGHRAERHVVVFADLSERARTARPAHRDALTGLPDRALFHDLLVRDLRRAARDGAGVAVLVLDLDGFRAINENHGHAVGDAVLRTVASRIRAVVRAPDSVGRLGGDEFAIVAETAGRVAEGLKLAERTLATVAEPIDSGGRSIALRASLGIAIAPADGSDAERLLRHAETALSRAKQDGAGAVRFFSSESDREARERATLVGDLLGALDRDELELVWQPVRDVATSRTVGAEGLLRWAHPSRGRADLTALLSNACDERLRVGLGSWAIREACEMAARWARMTPSPRVSVDLTGAEVRVRDVIETMRSAVRDLGLPDRAVSVEIAERVLVRQARHLAPHLEALRAAGGGLVVDDAGLDDPRLAYLEEIEADGVKVAAAVVAAADKDDGAVLRSVVAAARARGLEVCAKGIESSASLEIARRGGATHVQGPHVGGPLAADEFERSLLRTAG